MYSLDLKCDILENQRGVGLRTFMRCSSGCFFHICSSPFLTLLCASRDQPACTISMGSLAFWFPVGFGNSKSRDWRVMGEQEGIYFTLSGQGLVVFLLMKTPDPFWNNLPKALIPRLRNDSLPCAPSDLGAVVASCTC